MSDNIYTPKYTEYVHDHTGGLSFALTECNLLPGRNSRFVQATFDGTTTLEVTEGAEWLSTAFTEHGIILTTDINTTDEERTATVKLTNAAEEEAELTVKQPASWGPGFAVKKAAFSATATDGTAEIEIVGDLQYPWTAFVGNTWCTLDKYSGIGADKIVATLEDNTTEHPRTAVVTIRSGKHVIEVNIVQEAS